MSISLPRCMRSLIVAVRDMLAKWERNWERQSRRINRFCLRSDLSTHDKRAKVHTSLGDLFKAGFPDMRKG